MTIPCILVVEDEQDIRESLEELLSDFGYAVRSVSTATEALAELQSGFRPGLLLIDYQLPGMNGAELLGAIAQAHPGWRVPVIVTSATHGAGQFFTDAGFPVAGFLKKPFDVHVLIALLDTHIPTPQS